MSNTSMVREWLVEMQSSVRAVDYARAEHLFALDVVGFGTYEGMAKGRPVMRSAQWSHIWPTIRDFTFRLDDLHAGSEGDLAWGACPWTSTGYGPDGSAFSRPGRMTVVLERRKGRWLAIHTHFSLFPASGQ